MKIYRLVQGILLEENHRFYLLPGADWDEFVNDDALFEKTAAAIQTTPLCENGPELLQTQLLAPAQGQEIWAAGVTYYRSKVGREEESKAGGGSDFYARVYEAERPELFFKALPHRCVPHGGAVRIRRDSDWNVPEPELTLMLTRSGNIVGYTIGNDMSSRSIEGENPLYLPQAKTYDGSAALGPCLYVTNAPLPPETVISIQIYRQEQLVFQGETAISQIKRRFDELAGWLFRECSFPQGALLMTGTGIVPGSDFTLHAGDEIHIQIEPIGTLVNSVS